MLPDVDTDTTAALEESEWNTVVLSEVGKAIGFSFDVVGSCEEFALLPEVDAVTTVAFEDSKY